MKTYFGDLLSGVRNLLLENYNDFEAMPFHIVQNHYGFERLFKDKYIISSDDGVKLMSYNFINKDEINENKIYDALYNYEDEFYNVHFHTKNFRNVSIYNYDSAIMYYNTINSFSIVYNFTIDKNKLLLNIIDAHFGFFKINDKCYRIPYSTLQKINEEIKTSTHILIKEIELRNLIDKIKEDECI